MKINVKLTRTQLNSVFEADRQGWSNEWASGLNDVDAQRFYAEIDYLSVGNNSVSDFTADFISRVV